MTSTTTNSPFDKYAIYLRKSRADLELERLGEGETLARHAEILRQLAEKHKIKPEQIETYREVVSGETIQDRPQMQALLRAVSAGEYKAVLVVEIERLARGNTSDQGRVADAFTYSNTRIITPQKVYDPSNEFDQEYFEFGLFMSRREYKTIHRRLQAGKIQSVQMGNYLGSFVPYGYEAVRTSKRDRHLEVVPEQAAIVQRIFREALDGKTPYQIAKGLTLDGIPSPRSGGEWGKSTITRILQNPVYIGKIRWNGSKTTRMLADDGTTVKRRVKCSDPLLVDGNHTALVGISAFDAIQGAFKGVSPVGENKHMVNPLAGLLRCSKCHRAIVYVSPSKKAPNARYSHKNVHLCQQAYAPAELVQRAISQKLREILQDSEIIVNSGGSDDQIAERQKRRGILEEAVRSAEGRVQRIYDSYEQGIYSAAEFINRRQAAQRELDALKVQLKEQTNIVKVQQNEQIARLHDAIDLLDNYSIPAEEKNKFLKSIIRNIWYDNDGETLQLVVELT